MDRVKGLNIALLAVFLALVPMMECQEPFVPNRPLCISQLAIVNHACSMLPYSPLPPPAPPSPAPAPAPAPSDEGGEDDEGDHDDDDDDHHDGDDDSGGDDEGGDDSGGGGGSDDEGDNQRRRRHGHGHGHAHGHGHGNNTTHHGRRHHRHHSRHHRHRHAHRHRVHRHRHRYHQEESPIQEECCRWLKQVDSACVCQLLVHLPPFLAKPAHEYTVIVDESCSVTFTCGGRLKLTE